MVCDYCRTVQALGKSNCPNCGAAYPTATPGIGDFQPGTFPTPNTYTIAVGVLALHLLMSK